MTELDRRAFLQRGATVAAGSALLGGPFAGFLAAPAVAGAGRDNQNALRPVPDLRDGQVRLLVPEGFQYRSFQPSSRANPITLDDGSKLPGRHDGMAAFAGKGDGTAILVRNHEENGSLVGASFGAAGTPTYDTSTHGGTSTVHVSDDGQVQYSYASLAGTQMNCSGGKMPWGSWITCEETVNGYDIGDDFTRGTAPPSTYIQNARLEKRHGYIFEVPAEGGASAQPVTSAGRFAHEAVALDPKEGVLYLTEDNFGFPSGFYKYVPPSDPQHVGRLEDGGTLWMLKVVGQDRADLARHQENGTSYAIEWVTIDQPDFDFGRPSAGSPPSRTNDDAISFVGNQGRVKGAARFSRLEGAVYDHGWVFWTSTQGGGAPEPADADSVGGWGNGRGQIWGLDLKAQQLHMLYESPGPEILDFPDNVTTSARGTLILCEDGGNFNYLRGLTRDGELFDIAKNGLPGSDANDEFAGATFGPGGRTLYVNIQDTLGISFAIWGPWGRVGV